MPQLQVTQSPINHRFSQVSLRGINGPETTTFGHLQPIRIDLRNDHLSPIQPGSVGHEQSDRSSTDHDSLVSELDLGPAYIVDGYRQGFDHCGGVVTQFRRNPMEAIDWGIPVLLERTGAVAMAREGVRECVEHVLQEAVYLHG